jgi:NDP-hexose 2,3-enoyl reductase
MEQLDGPIDALSIELDGATLGRLDELFPAVGNGGPGPEAWAW